MSGGLFHFHQKGHRQPMSHTINSLMTIFHHCPVKTASMVWQPAQFEVPIKEVSSNVPSTRSGAKPLTRTEIPCSTRSNRVESSRTKLCSIRWSHWSNRISEFGMNRPAWNYYLVKKNRKSTFSYKPRATSVRVNPTFCRNVLSVSNVKC